jgi:hypothetical protein
LLDDFEVLESNFLSCFRKVAVDIQKRRNSFKETKTATPSLSEVANYRKSINDYATVAREGLIKILSKIFDYDNTLDLEDLENQDEGALKKYSKMCKETQKSRKKNRHGDIQTSDVMLEFFWDSSTTSSLKEGEGKENFLLALGIFFRILEYNHTISKPDLDIVSRYFDENNLWDIITNGIEGHDYIRQLANYSHENKDLDWLSNELHVDKTDDFLEKITTFMRSILLLQYVIQPKEVNFESYIIELNRKISQRIAASGAISKTMQLQRLKNLPWGPKNYVRNKETVDNVISKLIQNGVVSLTGWGGVGKTALAQKIIVVEEDKYDYIIQNTLKIASRQPTYVPTADGPSFVETTTDITGMDSIHRSENINGSARELFSTIISMGEGPLLFEDETLETEDLMNKALKVLRENKYLVLIDNYEDIETPPIGDSVIKESTLREKAIFSNFFEIWEQEYSRSNQAQIEGTGEILGSRLIITSRGSGAGVQATIPVPWLDIDDSLTLYHASLLDRRNDRKNKIVIDQETIETWNSIQGTDARDAFSGWNTTEFESHDNESESDYKGHPMLVRQAAYIYDGMKYGFAESISEMDPKGKKAKEIADYCTSKCLEVLSEEYEKAMYYIANLPSGIKFTTTDLAGVASFDEDPKEQDFFANEFCSEMEKRGFLTKSKNQEGRYAMIIGIKRQIQKSTGFDNWRSEQGEQVPEIYDDDFDDTEDRVFDESISADQFSYIFDWLNALCNQKEVTSELIGDWDDVIDGLGNTENRVKERVRTMPTIPLVVLYAKLCGANGRNPPIEALLPKIAEASTQLILKTKSQPGSRSPSHTKIDVANVKIVQNNNKVRNRIFSSDEKKPSLLTWFGTISIEILNRMSVGPERLEPELILRTIDKNLTILEKLVRTLPECKAIAKQLSGEYIQFIHHAIRQARSYDGSDWESIETKENIMQSIIHKTCLLWGNLTPNSVSGKDTIFTINPTTNPQANSNYGDILNLFTEQIETCTNHDLGAYIYWMSLIWLNNNSVKTTKNYDSTESNALNLLSNFEEQGFNVVGVFMNEQYFQGWKNRILASRQNFILTVEDVENARIGRNFKYGLNGKFIQLDANGKNVFPSIKVVYVYQNDSEEHRVKNIKDLIYLINTVEFKKEYDERGKENSVAILYVSPVIHENYPMTKSMLVEKDGLKLIGLESIGFEITEAIKQNNFLDKQIKWNDLLKNVSKSINVNLEKLMADLFGKKNYSEQIDFFCDIVQNITLNRNLFVRYPDEEQTNIPVLCRKVFKLEKQWKYQIEHPQSEKQIYSERLSPQKVKSLYRRSKKVTQQGCGLPKNPKLTHHLMKEFCRLMNENERITYQDLIIHFETKTPHKLFGHEIHTVDKISTDFAYILSYLSKGDAAKIGKESRTVIPWDVFRRRGATVSRLATSVKGWLFSSFIPRTNDSKLTRNLKENVIEQYFKDVLNS